MTDRMERQKQPISMYTRWLGIFFLSLILGTLQIGAMGSLLKLMALIPVFIWLFGKRSVRFSSPIRWAFLYVIWLALTCMWSIEQSASFSRTISQVSFLLLLLSAASYDFTEHEIDFLKKCLVWSSRITAAAVLVSASYLVGRIYLNGIVYEDPNYLCAYFSFALIVALMSLISGEARGKQRLICILELIVYAYIVLGTGSRGGMFAIVGAVAIVILFTRPKRNKAAHLFRRASIVLVLFVAAYIATTFIEKDILLRFTMDEIEASGGTGRYEIWDNALDAYGSSDVLRQLVGYGTGTAKEITHLFSVFQRHSVFHNMFVESLLEAGAFGLVLYVMHLGAFFGAAIKNRDLFCVATMVCMIILSLSTSIYTFKPYWNIMLFILCLGRQVPSPDGPALPDEPYSPEPYSDEPDGETEDE